MSHPDDDNGDVLQRMVANGDDLSQPRNINFNIVFADEEFAEQFAGHFKSLGYKVASEFNEVEPGFPWDVCVVKNMVPTAWDIEEFENQLQDVADKLGGHNDGWGCFSVPSLQ